MPRRPKQKSPRGERAASRVVVGVRTRWSGFRPFVDFWGNEIPRFYQLETLSNAVDFSLRTKKDRFIIPSIQQILGPSPVTSVSFELFQEGRYQLIFHVRAVNSRRKQGQFAFVVAKRSDDYSKLAAGEHANLRVLHERVADSVVKPFRGGYIYLPDRHGRIEHGRDVYGYLTQWLTGFHELGVNANMQFIINVKDRHTFTIAQTEELKAKIVEIIARTYSPAKKDCMDMPEIASGDFVVSRSPRPRLKLIASRRLLRKTTPLKLLDKIAGSSWDWGGHEFRIAPQQAEMFYDAFSRVFGKQETRDIFVKYAAAINSGKIKEKEGLPREALNDLV